MDEQARKLDIRAAAQEQHAARRHARTWTPPADHGTLSDELALPDDEPEWRFDCVLGVGHNVIVPAGRKCGKTTLIGDVIKAYVDERPFLNTFKVTPPDDDATVAVFNYELDERQYRRWLRDLGIVNTDRVHVLHLRGTSLPLRDARIQAWVAAWLRERRAGLWIPDPYSRAYTGSLDNGNDEAQVNAFLDTLDIIKAKAGVSELVMPVHTPKAKADPGEESAIGSQRLEAWPDAMWYLTRDLATGQRFFRAEGRDVDVPEAALIYDAATRLSALSGAGRAESRRNADVDAVLTYVREHPGCSGRDIYGALGWGNDRFKAATHACGDRLHIEDGKNRAKHHYVNELLINESGECTGALERSGTPVHSGALLSIESTTAHHPEQRRNGAPNWVAAKPFLDPS